jgi:hypothetical protein
MLDTIEVSPPVMGEVERPQRKAMPFHEQRGDYKMGFLKGHAGEIVVGIVVLFFGFLMTSQHDSIKNELKSEIRRVEGKVDYGYERLLSYHQTEIRDAAKREAARARKQAGFVDIDFSPEIRARLDSIAERLVARSSDSQILSQVIQNLSLSETMAIAKKHGFESDEPVLMAALDHVRRRLDPTRGSEAKPQSNETNGTHVDRSKSQAAKL